MSLCNDQSFQVRHATVDDLIHIIDLHLDVKNTNLLIHPLEEKLKLAYCQHLINRWKISESVPPCLILTDNHRIYGFLSYVIHVVDGTNDSHCIEILTIYIDPNERGKHFGALLCNALVEKFKGEVIQCVKIWVSDCNQLAKQFFAKYGFTQTNRRRRQLVYQGRSIVEIEFLLNL